MSIKCEIYRDSMQGFKRYNMSDVKKVYISGKITGTTDYLERFEKAEKYIREELHAIPYNPAKVNSGMPTETTYEEYMKIAFAMLDMCGSIYLLKGWEKSVGANREYGYALGRDMNVIKED